MDFRHAPVGRKRYVDPAGLHRALGLYCLGAGDQVGHVVPVRARRLNSHAAVLVGAGSGSFTSRSGTVQISGPMLFWLFPGVEHSYGPDANGWSAQWVLFDGPAAATYRELGVLSPARPVAGLAPDSPTAQTMDRLVDVVLSDERALAATGLLHLLVASAGGRLTTPAEQLLADLRQHASQDLSVAAHATRLGLSKAALRAAVRDAAGVTPKQFIESVRMERAQLLLSETDRAVASIARELGYEDPGYFSRVFTRRAGVAPTIFRTQQR